MKLSKRMIMCCEGTASISGVSAIIKYDFSDLTPLTSLITSINYFQRQSRLDILQITNLVWQWTISVLAKITDQAGNSKANANDHMHHVMVLAWSVKCEVV